MINTMEEFSQLDDKQIQLVLRELDSENLAIALISASTDLQVKIFSNISERAIDALKNDMTKHMNIDRSKIQQEQSNIVSIANSILSPE